MSCYIEGKRRWVAADEKTPEQSRHSNMISILQRPPFVCPMLPTDTVGHWSDWYVVSSFVGLAVLNHGMHCISAAFFT